MNRIGCSVLLFSVGCQTPELARPEPVDIILQQVLGADRPRIRLGRTTDGVGDVDGDGYDDVIVGVSYDDDYRGSSRLYRGGPGGIEEVESWRTSSDQAGSETGARHGRMSAGAGDVNGDEYPDLVVGAVGYSGPERGEGRAQVFMSGPAGPSTEPAWEVQSDVEDGRLGWSAGRLGDVNGDGYGDLGVASPFWSEGKAFAYLGGPDGLEATPSWSAQGATHGSRFGEQISAAGDVDGDGYDDVIVGSPKASPSANEEGCFSVFAGGPDGLGEVPDAVRCGGLEYAELGIAVSFAGDVDGDGFGDVIVGAWPGVSGRGEAQLYRGGPGGIEEDPSWTIVGLGDEGRFGTAVSSAGDVNADGYDDVLVGAPEMPGEFRNEGFARLYLGGPEGLAKSPAWEHLSGQRHAYYGIWVAPARDVDGDGCMEFLVGAKGYTLSDRKRNPEDIDDGDGAVFVYGVEPCVPSGDLR